MYVKKYILSCDLETTGVSPSNDDWITGSFGLLDFDTLDTIKELEVTSRPNVWSQEAALVHKIRKADALEFTPRKKALEQIIEFLPPFGSFYFLCHANTNQFGQYVHFDFACLKMDFFTEFDMFEFRKYFNDQDCISTHSMASELAKAKVLPKDLELTLEELCKYFKIPYGKHQAKGDRISCQILYSKLRGLYGSIGDRSTELNTRTSKTSRSIGSQDQQRFCI